MVLLHSKNLILFLGVLFFSLVFATPFEARARSGHRALKRRGAISTTNTPKSPYIVNPDKSLQFFFDHLPKTGAVSVQFQPGTYTQQLKIHRKAATHIYAVKAGTVSILHNENHQIGESARSNQAVAPLWVTGCTNFTMENIDLFNLPQSALVQPGPALSIEKSSTAHITSSKMTGLQDTVHIGEKSNVLFKGCTIAGTIDFIYGNGLGWFDSCTLNSKRDFGTIAAMKGMDGSKNGAFFSNCHFTADLGVTNVFIARPYDSYSKVACLNCQMEDHLKGNGFEIWSPKSPHIEHVTFAEYNSMGPGALGGTISFREGTPLGVTTKRTTKYFAFKLSRTQAADFTLDNFFNKYRG